MMIVLSNIYKSYSSIKILEDFSLEIPQNTITTLFGPSGCGKTTLINILAGLETYESGSIKGIDHHKFSYVFQEPRLIPWKTVYENLEYILSKEYPKIEKDHIINEHLKSVNLYDVKDHYPNTLSGGMKQRVSIARAFCYPSSILLMDEPFKGLDNKLKNELITNFLTLWFKEPKTVLFITHNIEEALLMSNRIIKLSDKPISILKQLEINQPHLNRDLKNSPILREYTDILSK